MGRDVDSSQRTPCPEASAHSRNHQTNECIIWGKSKRSGMLLARVGAAGRGRGPGEGPPPEAAVGLCPVELRPAALSARRAHSDQVGRLGRVRAAVYLVGKGRLGTFHTIRFLQAVSSPERGIRPALMRSPSFRPCGLAGSGRFTGMPSCPHGGHHGLLVLSAGGFMYFSVHVVS